MTALAPVLEGFFVNRLAALRASQHTVAGYRDTYRLLLAFAQRHTGVAPSRLDLSHLDADLIRAFLDHLETDRGNRISSRNQRMAAIHALFRYAALRCPEHAELIQRVLAIPTKRCEKPLVTFLTRDESEALIGTPDPHTSLGRRDQLLLAVAIHTGLRVSELTGLTCADVAFGVGAHVRCVGKGRKERCTPLTKPLARQLHAWLHDRQAEPAAPLFPSLTGRRMSTDAVQRSRSWLRCGAAAPARPRPTKPRRAACGSRRCAGADGRRRCRSRPAGTRSATPSPPRCATSARPVPAPVGTPNVPCCCRGHNAGSRPGPRRRRPAAGATHHQLLVELDLDEKEG